MSRHFPHLGKRDAKTESNVDWVLAIDSAGKLGIKLQVLNHPTKYVAIALFSFNI